ncbi:MAG: hypothetical protein CMJ53_10075 [Planctomycetaceae bacterium]|nr:hypothetical protein [Planctomycetaceae bacterium]
MLHPESAPSVTTRLRIMLDEHDVAYRHLRHEPTPTSEDSARVRGEPLEIGGKALVLKVDGRHVVLVISAARRLDSKRLKKHLKARSMRFVTPEELLELTDLVPGSVPPFGRPLLELDLLADVSVLAHERIAFNAGSLSESIIMSTSDWQAVSRPQALLEVSSEPPATPLAG